MTSLSSVCSHLFTCYLDLMQEICSLIMILYTNIFSPYIIYNNQADGIQCFHPVKYSCHNQVFYDSS